MSIFPQGITQAILTPINSSANLPLAKEYAWDYIKNDFLLTNGKNTMVTGIEAVKVWIYKALNTSKNRYSAYSGNYGNELDDSIGQGLSNGALESEVERYIKESLLINPYINGLNNFVITISDNLNVSFNASTIYGEVSISV